MAVTLNANNAAAFYTDILTSGAHDHSGLTIAAGSNIALIVMIAWSAQGNGFTVIWDPTGANQTLTSLATINAAAGGVGRVDLYGVLNPATGNKVCRLNMTSGFSGEAFMNAMAVDGADQAAIATTFINAATATGNSTTGSTGTVTSPSGDMSVGIVSGPQVMSAPTQTQLFVNNSGQVTSAGGSRSSSVNPAHAWTFASAVEWCAAGINIKAAGGASAALTGTAVGGITEGDLVAGGKVITVTLTGDTFISN